ncbi:solute carrier family 22 member 16-like isoform X1 [Pectinophora gossypiella]|uniref:solute carrier family 22 member 16-like isoform X1 n=1 Tax=Pectinophora gossypiella TaxID=13191 RepID=UPI00214F047C|nr:solute carrier family 22 member 16-like isoform X1 [Pectinophora gossypiella]
MKTLWKIILRKGSKMEVSEESNDENTREKDYVVKSMGSFGVYQAVVCIVAGVARFIPIWNLLSIIFITPTTEFICKEFKNNVTKEVDHSICYEDCVEYEYDEMVFKRSVVSSYGLVCEKAWMNNFINTVMILGVLIGSLLYGWVSDRHGRRNAFRLSTFFSINFMFVILFSPNIWTFTVFRAIIGTTSGGILVISIVYIMEVIGSKYRESAVCWIISSDSIAAALLSVFAYYTTTWDIFLFYCEIASIFIFALVLGLPETPQWLVTNAKTDKAIQIVASAAKWNKLETIDIKENIKKYVEEFNIEEKKMETNYIHLFRNRDLTFKTICIFLLFTQAGIASCGLNDYVQFVEPDIYMSLVIHGLMQVLISILAVVSNNISTRKTLIVILLFTTSLSMASATILPEDYWITAICSTIGWSATIILLAVLFMYTVELYPTSLRNMAVGLGTSGLLLGALVTSSIAGVTPPWVAPFISTALSSLAAFFCVFLPETKGYVLKNTVDW